MSSSEQVLLRDLKVEKIHHRIESIDLLRGIVIIIMALDHSRQYLGYGSFFSHPTDLADTTSILFLTRWITHFCAPVFVFLAGTSAFLYGSRKNTKKEVSKFLFTRGLWLVILELTIVNFGWNFDISMSLHVFQVIWAIGVSMISLSIFLYLPKKVLLALGIILVIGHNSLDSITASGSSTGDVLWYILHQQNLVVDGNSVYFFLYPVIPWIGTMILGYLFGELYSRNFDSLKRKTILTYLGLGCIFLFILLRSFNIYGDPAHWQIQKDFVYSVFSFINTTKYPPSLLFLLMTLGPSFLVLRYIENIQNRLTAGILVFGRVPLFFYVIHIYMFHLAALIAILLVGRPAQDAIMTSTAFLNAVLSDFGFELYVTYLVWIAVVLALYPLCKMYNDYKRKNKDKWWLSYL